MKKYIITVTITIALLFFVNNQYTKAEYLVQFEKTFLFFSLMLIVTFLLGFLNQILLRNSISDSKISLIILLVVYLILIFLYSPLNAKIYFGLCNPVFSLLLALLLGSLIASIYLNKIK